MRKIFFSFTDVFAGDGGQVHAIKRKAEARGQPASGECFACAGRTEKKSTYSGAVARDGGGSESIHEAVTRAAAEKELIEFLTQEGRHDEGVISDPVAQRLRVRFKAGAFAGPGCFGKIAVLGRHGPPQKCLAMGQTAEMGDAPTPVTVVVGRFICQG